MTGQLTGYEETSVVEVGAVLDTSPATPEEVYLRTMAYSERAIAAVAAKRAGSGGANFNGGTITGGIFVDGSPGDVNLLSADSDYGASGYAGIVDFASADGSVLSALTDGEVSVRLYQADTNGFRVIDSAHVTKPLVKANLVGFVLGYHAAPADGDLNAGECAVWFDQTNGSAALNIKAKQADGAVKTATIPLS